MAFGDGGKLLGCGGTTNVTNAFGGILAGRPELTMLTPVRGKGL